MPDKTIEPKGTTAKANDVAVIDTSMGVIKVELDKSAPVTVENFKRYVNEEFYDGLIFHRVIDNFMIQGGGFDQNLNQKQTKAPIKLEANLPNLKGTIAMARTNFADSATSQFFINLVDNGFLNPSPGNPGYAVFGKVIDGMDVVETIGKVPTTTKKGMADVPVEIVKINSIIITYPFG